MRTLPAPLSRGADAALRGALSLVLLLLPCARAARAQTPRSATPSLADLRWTASETAAGRFTIVPGERGFVGGYRDPGLEVWASPLQLLRDYRITFRAEGDTSETDGRSALRTVDQTPTTTTRVYTAAGGGGGGGGVTVRERIFTPVDAPGATIGYTVESSRPVVITVHFTPTLNLMWPAGVGGQEAHWDSTHSAYVLEEPSHRFRGAVVSRQIVAHDRMQNDTRAGPFERDHAFTLRVAPGSKQDVVVAFAGSSVPDEDPIAIAESLASRQREYEDKARARYAALRPIDIETPDSTVNRALRWAQVTLEQAWACNPQLGCGMIAGYGPSRNARRPQYAWFFAGDGLVAVNAFLREGAYDRARDELAFIMRYQDKRTGMVWHELSQSAGFLNWAADYPYMFVHVDISFDFLDGVRDYVRTTGDVAFAKAHWDAIRSAYEYCRSTLAPGDRLPSIPAGKQGGNEQDPQRDELTTSLAWVGAAESFAVLAELTGHADLAADARRSSELARGAIRPAYYDTARGRWASGHLRSGAPVEGLTGSLIALLHHGMLSDAEQRMLLDTLASPSFRAPWGLRSTPTNDPHYDPDAYARGSVWALGTSSAVMAFYEAGRPSTATALWRDLVPWFELDSPGHMHEVLRGDRFAPERESVPDQTWSPAAFLSSAVSGLLGIDLDGGKRQLRFAPHLPPEWNGVRVRRVNLAGADVGLALRTSADVVELDVENAGPAFTLRFSPELATGARVRRVDVRNAHGLRTTTPAGGGYEVEVLCPGRLTSRLTLHLSRPDARSAPPRRTP